MQVFVPTSADLHSIVFADSANGWIVGRLGTILRTTNAGKVWSLQSTPTLSTLASVRCVNSAEAWACGDTLLLHTSDGGSTWQSAAASVDVTEYTMLECAGPSNLWCAVRVNSGGANGAAALFHSTNGGAGWGIPIAFGNSATSIIGIQFFNPRTGLFVANGPSVTIYRTTDSGVSWQSRFCASGTARSVRFADSANGWIVGDLGLIVRTTDGGQTWNNQTSGTFHTLGAITTEPTGVAWSAGGNGTMMHSVDGGLHWDHDSSFTNRDLLALAASAPGEIWVAGQNGIVFHHSASTEGPPGLNGFTLLQNFPNPFSHSTTIPFTLEAPGLVRLELFDILGRRVRVLFDAECAGGQHGISLSGEHLASGAYWCIMSLDGSTMSRRIMIVR
jgi:photosystem II stability/assembly factor-like uncharacterized protein